MRLMLASVVFVLALALFGPAALAVAGDEVPGGSAVPPTVLMAGDEVPGGS